MAPRNYTESEIILNLKKNHKVKKFIKIKSINSSQKGKKNDNKNSNRDTDSMLNAINNIINKNKPKTPYKTQDTTILSKKEKKVLKL